jgi:hypothetical protein
MRETKCETVRHELEDLMLGDECSMYATQHLRECDECDDCRQFHQKQTKLRQIIGSLGTVEAPADFDFRLRARLANESSSAGFHLRSMHWSFATKGFAAATMVLLFVGGVVYVRTIMHQSEKIQLVEQRTEPPQPTPKPSENEASVRNATPVVVASDNAPRRVAGERRVSSGKKPSLVAVDLGSERPPVFSDAQLHSAIFPIDASASLEPFKVSLDDGRGNARTISVPTITFGSQRVLPNSNQFVQKGVGVW